MTDEPGTALAVARAGMEKAQRLGLRNREILLAGNAMMAALRTGDWDWALQASTEVLRDEPLTVGLTEVNGYTAVMAALRGDGGERLARNISILEPQVSATQDPQYNSVLVVIHGWESLIAGDFAAVWSHVPFQYEDPTYASSAYSLAGHAALWAGNLDRAVYVSDHLNRLGVRGQWVDASRRSLEAGIAALSGSPAEAAAGFAEATRMLRDHDMPLDLAFCLMDEAVTLGVSDGAGRNAADEARKLLTDLGAVALIDRLDRLMSDGIAARTEARVGRPDAEPARVESRA
jgi:hypothetical protein